MFCMNCGKQIPDESVFCQYCGKPVVMVAPQVQPAPVAAPQPQPAPAYTPAPQQVAPQPAPAAPVYPQVPQQVAPQPVPVAPAYTPAPQQVAPQPAPAAPVYPQVPQQVAPQPAPAAPVYPQVPQQVAPQPQMQAVPQPIAQPQMQAAPQAAPQPQPAPAVPTVQGFALSMAPVCCGLISPKNAAKERIQLENAAMWYVEITNNMLVFSKKGGTASMMFGAIGALATIAACDLKPVMSYAANQIRNLKYESKLGGQVLILEMIDGKLLQVKAKINELNQIEAWWRSQFSAPQF